MRSMILLPLILVIFLSCQSQDQTLEVTGTVSSPTGQPFKLAHIHVYALGGSPYQPIQSAAVASDGTFRIKLPDWGYYQIAVTAVDHQMSSFPLFADHHDRISIDIELAPLVYKENLDDVRIAGSWNQFNSRAAEPMVKAEDGTYHFTVETESDTIGYQLANIDANVHTINGPMADFYEYDGGGDYKSMLLVKDGKAEIILDPAALTRVSEAGLPKATYDDRNKELEEMVALSSLMEKRYAEWRNEQSALRAGTVEPEQVDTDFSTLKSALMEAMNQMDDALLSRYAAVQLGKAATIIEVFPMDAEEYKSIIQHVPVTDRMWLVSPYIMDEVFKNALGEEESIAYFEKNLNLIEHKGVKVYALLAIGYAAKTSSDVETQTRIYNELDSAYSEFRDLDYYVRNLDPALKIAPGKMVPDFTVTLLGKNKKISRDAFKGKYLLMDFWATWCGPCLGEMAGLHQAWETFKSKKFQILSLSFERSPDEVVKFREKRWKMPWMHTFLKNGFQDELSKNFEVMGIPKPILIDPEGKIVAVGDQLRGINLEKTLSAYLN